jgi:hypothetical protein
LSEPDSSVLVSFILAVKILFDLLDVPVIYLLPFRFRFSLGLIDLFIDINFLASVLFYLMLDG